MIERDSRRDVVAAANFKFEQRSKSSVFHLILPQFCYTIIKKVRDVVGITSAERFL